MKIVQIKSISWIWLSGEKGSERKIETWEKWRDQEEEEKTMKMNTKDLLEVRQVLDLGALFGINMDFNMNL